MRLFAIAAVAALLLAGGAAQAHSQEPAATCESLSALQSDFLTKEQAYQLGQQYAECLKRRKENAKAFQKGVDTTTPPTRWECIFRQRNDPACSPPSSPAATTDDVADEARARGVKAHWSSKGEFVADDPADAKRVADIIADVHARRVQTFNQKQAR